MVKINDKPSLKTLHVEKFWDNVDKHCASGCWEWLGVSTTSGYGRFKVDGHSIAAHRISYYLCTDIWPGDLIVCHSCDNPCCVNPEHLWLGTHADNNRDKEEKGRGNHPFGEEHGQTALRNDDVIQIKEMIKEGLKGTGEIGRIFGVSAKVIRRIRAGNWWNGVGEDMKQYYTKPRKLTANEVLAINALSKTGVLTQREIGIIFGVRQSTVGKIKHGERWAHLTGNGEYNDK
jgi:hypothetical protein